MKYTKKTKSAKVDFSVQVMRIRPILAEKFSANVSTFQQDYSVDLSQMQKACSGLLFSKKARLEAEYALRIAEKKNEEQHPFSFERKLENSHTTWYVRYRGVVKREVAELEKQAPKSKKTSNSNNELERQKRELFIKTEFFNNAVDFGGYKVLPLVAERKTKYYKDNGSQKEPFGDFYLSELKRTCFIFEKDGKFYLSVSSKVRNIELFLNKSVFKRGFAINEMLLAGLKAKRQESPLEIENFLEMVVR